MTINYTIGFNNNRVGIFLLNSIADIIITNTTGGHISEPNHKSSYCDRKCFKYNGFTTSVFTNKDIQLVVKIKFDILNAAEILYDYLLQSHAWLFVYSKGKENIRPNLLAQIPYKFECGLQFFTHFPHYYHWTK